MDSPNTAGSQGEMRPHWIRGLRPLLWWALFVLALYGYRRHQILSEQTLLQYGVTLQGRAVDYECEAGFDGTPIRSGRRIPIGWHTVTISHPKAEPWRSNLFVWYGTNDLGKVALTRGKGTLAVQATPPAPLLTIRGPEFSLTLTNSTGTTVTVPTDSYRIEAQYSHWAEAHEVTVFPNMPSSWKFNPLLGDLQITCSHRDASYRLLRDGQLVESGELPSLIKELPMATYNVVVFHHGNQHETSALVRAGTTNNANVALLYGATTLESDPSGATVFNGAGRALGVTPLRLTELPVGRWEFVLRRDGYETAAVTMDISAAQTNSVRTVLVNSSYVGAMNAARRHLQAGDYDRAYEASSEALRLKANDPDATNVRKESIGKLSVQRAEAHVRRGDYGAGIQELESALQSVPENGEVKRLLASYKKREEERIERVRQENASRPKAIFDAILEQDRDAKLFDEQRFRSRKPVKEVETSIINTLQNLQPGFLVGEPKYLEPGTFVIEAKQEVPRGMRRCVIVGGQGSGNETLVLCTVVEYTSGQSITALGILSIKSNLVLSPVHASRVERMTDILRQQVADGVQIMRGRLQRAME